MGKNIIGLINNPIFFSVEDYENPLDFNKKAEYMISLPNSYLPLMKKQINSKDPICAPLYMNQREIDKFSKPLMLSNKYYGASKFGMSFGYNLDLKEEMQSNFIYHQRLFFDKILKERLTNKAAYGSDADYELPITLYEPNTFLRRFCDLFCYITVGLEEIYSKSEYDEEVIIRKLFSSFLAGFHKPMASQGIPLKPLIGETYECESENRELQLFAEVKNDDPVHIVYNIRWRKRKACLDGNVLMKWSFNESLDEIRVKMGGVNTLRLYYENIKGYKIFTFNFPLRCTFKGIVDPIKDKMERNMSVDSFIYIKGETKSSIIGLNHLSHNDIFTAFYGMITKSIINYETLKNGHSFFGVIFHNSGFSLENVPEGNILQAFAINTNRKIDSIEKLIEEKTKNDMLKKEKKNGNIQEKNEEKENPKEVYDPRFAKVSWEDFLNEEDIAELSNKGLFLNNIYIQENNKNNSNKNNADKDKFILDDNTKNKQNNKFVNNEKVINFDKSDNNFDNDESELLQKKQEIKGNFERKKTIKNKRLNIYPYKIYYKLFKKTIVSISKLSTSSAFISSFNMHFIYKLYVGSWAHLNFFEIAYQGNEMNEFYIKYKMGVVNARPISVFNLKKGLKVEIENNNFFGKYKSLYGKLWKSVQNPLITDTRYREDLLWLNRFYEIVEKYPENERDPDLLDLYDKLRLEAFLNAGKWKEILEAYNYLNISNKINVK